jgi:cytochrome bd-type quinol oxidase subunit 2
MEFTYKLFLVLHFIGLAGLLGGLLAQIQNKPKQLQKLVMHSALLMLIAGVVMVGVNQMMHADDPTIEVLDHVKIAIKSTVLIVILALGYLNIKKSELSNKVWVVMTLLATANIVIAVFI